LHWVGTLHNIVRGRSKPAADSSIYAQLYGLTPAEARLAFLLAAGENVKGAAEKLRLAQSTLRSQLKCIFTKTHTSRQSEILRVLLLAPMRSAQIEMVHGSVLR
jgi:DNA-binding NarL/FixJ family response regulator